MVTSDGMRVRIFDLAHGLTEYEKIKFIRIVSSDYNLLIMQDYMPVIGKIDGTLTINSNEIDLEYDNIKAYYIHRDNEFNLMIEGS